MFVNNLIRRFQSDLSGDRPWMHSLGASLKKTGPIDSLMIKVYKRRQSLCFIILNKHVNKLTFCSETGNQYGGLKDRQTIGIIIIKIAGRRGCGGGLE